MTEKSCSTEFETTSTNLPKAKRQRREIPNECLCKGIKPNGNQCSFARLKDNMYCKRHIPKTVNIETNTCSTIMIDSSTNTEGTILDITTANKVILEFIDNRIEQEKKMDELIDLYNVLQEQLNYLQNI